MNYIIDKQKPYIILIYIHTFKHLYCLPRGNLALHASQWHGHCGRSAYTAPCPRTSMLHQSCMANHPSHWWTSSRYGARTFLYGEVLWTSYAWSWCSCWRSFIFWCGIAFAHLYSSSCRWWHFLWWFFHLRSPWIGSLGFGWWGHGRRSCLQPCSSHTTCFCTLDHLQCCSDGFGPTVAIAASWCHWPPLFGCSNCWSAWRRRRGYPAVCQWPSHWVGTQVRTDWHWSPLSCVYSYLEPTSPPTSFTPE